MGDIRGARRSRIGDDGKGGRKMDRWKQVQVCLGVFSVLCFLFAGVSGWRFFHRYSKGAEIYSQVRELAPAAEGGSSGDTPAMDFSGLLNMNPECVGWIRIPGTGIDYPVAQGEDNEGYLHTAFTGEYSDLGSIFMDYRNGGGFSDANTVLYGHDMWVGGEMFSQLTEYQDPEFLNAHPEVYIYTLDGQELKYKVFAVRVVDEADPSAFTRAFGSESEFLGYLDGIVEGQFYDTMERPGAEDKILTLSTCTNVRDNERLLVHAVLEQ